jgi:hypothetical protein
MYTTAVLASRFEVPFQGPCRRLPALPCWARRWAL